MMQKMHITEAITKSPPQKGLHHGIFYQTNLIPDLHDYMFPPCLVVHKNP